jgi:hypothetical protein
VIVAAEVRHLVGHCHGVREFIWRKGNKYIAHGRGALSDPWMPILLAVAKAAQP